MLSNRAAERNPKSLRFTKGKNEKEAEDARNEVKIFTEKKKRELIESRARQAQEITDIEADIEAAVKERIAERTSEGKKQVEKRKEELEKLKIMLDEQTKIRREQLNANSEILKDSEKVRQESLDALRDARMADVAAFNAKKLEMNQKTHETRITKEERLQISDEKRIDEQKKNLLKKEGVISTGMSNSAALLNSLALENNFETFKQECSNLRAKHRRFCIEYDNIESELLTVHDRMKNGKQIDYCDMGGLRSALRVFREAAMAFNCAGSTAEIEFMTKIGNVIELLTPLGTIFNTIESVIDNYEEDVKPGENAESGIGSLLVSADNSMKEIGLLIQQFNVIGDDHLQKTLAIQMEEAQSSRNHHAIQNGPPAYDSTPKSKVAAITEN
uniref:DUF4200 domain-containing protein n=1 Tax=Caenorhabditis tropicalis TaxID=1561998 RepID=A0A1I7SZ06_9PELO